MCTCLAANISPHIVRREARKHECNGCVYIVCSGKMYSTFCAFFVAECVWSWFCDFFGRTYSIYCDSLHFYAFTVLCYSWNMFNTYYPVVSAVVGTTNSCDMTGFEASGGCLWQERLSCFCHIFRRISKMQMLLNHISFCQHSDSNRVTSLECYKQSDC